MDSDGCTKQEEPAGVSYKTLGLILGSALIGAGVVLLFLRVSAGGVETFSTLALFGFLSMVVLATAATALSLTALSLSRKAEQAMSQLIRATPMDRFALPSAEEVASKVDDKLIQLKNDVREEMAALVEQSLPVGVARPAAETPGTSEQLAATLDHAEIKYSNFKDIVLLGVANYPGVQSFKVGEGHYRTTGDDLVDGVFGLKHERIAVCVFTCDNALSERFLGEQGSRVSELLQALFDEIKRKHFSRVFLVFDRVLNKTSPYAKDLNGFSARIDAETFERFELFEGSPEIVIPELTERVSQLAKRPPDQAAG
jgi:hypothetical protein